MKSTWIADPTMEQILHSTFKQADMDFSMFFESNSPSNEERLTGAFIKTLIDKFQPVNKVLQTWGRSAISGPWYVMLDYTDTTIRRGEKKWCADLSFILDVKVPYKIELTKAILVQAKKMESRPTNYGIVFENCWRIDVAQAKKLLRHTSHAFHIFYNPNHTGLGTRILPTTSLLSIAKANKSSTVLHSSQAISSTRRLADFMLYDFIGCWAGDLKSRVLEIARGKDGRAIPSHIIRIIITAEQG